MASPSRRLAANAPGPFYVDERCIDCGTCWQWDPHQFAPAGDHAHVMRQPEGAEETGRALLALQACPVAAIGAPAELVRATPPDGFPALLTRHPADVAPTAERRLQGEEPLALDAYLTLIPTPGHTAGSLVALLGEQILFSGDHLWWHTETQAVVASPRYCWWKWPRQLESVVKLRDLDVRWLLPAHGGRHSFAAGERAEQLDRTLAFCRATR